MDKNHPRQTAVIGTKNILTGDTEDFGLPVRRFQRLSACTDGRTWKAGNVKQGHGLPLIGAEPNIRLKGLYERCHGPES